MNIRMRQRINIVLSLIIFNMQEAKSITINHLYKEINERIEFLKITDILRNRPILIYCL